jgi:nucleoside phosphorylase
MKRDLLIITALQCEAAPLIDAWQLKPLRENPLGERFQVFCRDGIYVAVSGIGKVRSATATATLMSGVMPSSAQAPIVVNIGIAGSSTHELPIGELVYINKVRDVATNSRLYPDVLVAHHLHETALDTHDTPVTRPDSSHKLLVDMEGFGFLQAALTLTSPSHVCLLKVVSDHCTGTRVKPDEVRQMIERHEPSLSGILEALRTNLPEPTPLSAHEQALLNAVYAHTGLSLSQRLELGRLVRSLHAQAIPYGQLLTSVLETPVTCKEARNRVYHALVRNLIAEAPL